MESEIMKVDENNQTFNNEMGNPSPVVRAEISMKKQGSNGSID